MFDKIQNAKMQWLAAARKIQENAILYFIDLFLFYIDLLNGQVAGISENLFSTQASSLKKEWTKTVQTDTTKY